MKRVLKTVIASSLTTATFLSANIISAMNVSEDVSGIDSTSVLWSKAKSSEIMVYPQTTIKMNDKKANEANSNPKAKTIEVRAITDGKNIAFQVIWPDTTQSIQDGSSTTAYPDGFAVQFASDNTDPTKLPYIGMGSKNREVVVYLQKAVSSSYEPNGNGDVYHQVNRKNTHNFNSQINESLKEFDKEVEDLAIKDYQRAFVSEGFRSMTQIKDQSTSFDASMNYSENFFSSNEWEGTVSRTLNDAYLSISKEPFAVAFAVWDGEKMGRDGLKNLSTWVTVDMGNEKEALTFDQQIDKVDENADLKNGETLAQTNCASCHNYASNNSASAYMAPNLSNIGGYSSTSYLSESILEPNAVVVPGYNKNAHSNFAWYFDDGQGGRISAMPPFSHLKPKEINDIVAYLKTLKAQEEK